MTSKAELAQANEKTREVKDREEAVKETAKEAVHDVKQGAKDLANKTENMSIKDAPDRILPSAEKIDHKLQAAQDSLEEARTAKVGEKDLTRYPKIQQVFKDTQRVLEDNRTLLKEKTEDDTLSDAVRHTADLGALIQKETLASMDKLWTNWAALLTVVAGAGAGSWKQILQESGNLLNQVRHTEDFLRMINDLQAAFGNLAARATKTQPFGDKLDSLNKEWDQQRDKLMEDWKRIWAVLNESPIWRQLVVKGKALGSKISDVAGETKEEVSKHADKVADSEEVSKLKEDFKNVMQLIVGKDGPSVQPFLDYSGAAYNEIIENEDFSKFAAEMSELFENPNKAEGQSQAEYEEKYNKMYEDTKSLLDNTLNNRNLRLALRESRKLLRSAKKDPATRKLLEDAGKLITHISDNKGMGLLDPQLLNEIRAVLVPLLMEHLDNAPLPNYHGSDSNALGRFDYTLSEIRMGTLGLVPSKVKIEFRYKAEADPSQLKMKRQQMLMYLEASDIQLSFKDVKWQYNRHTIPRFSDNGTIDLATAGKGITLKLKAELHDYDAPQHASNLTELLSEPKERKMFKVLRAECDIDDFHVRISDAGTTNVFYEMLAGIWGTKIKHQIENLVEQKMNLLASKFDTQLYDIVRRATQPSLAEETKDALISAGKAAGEKIQETAATAKANLQSM